MRKRDRMSFENTIAEILKTGAMDHAIKAAADLAEKEERRQITKSIEEPKKIIQPY